MSLNHRLLLMAHVIATAVFAASANVHAQTGYGVTANGALFRFDVNAPATITAIGNMGIVTEAIDFRPGTGVLYGLDAGPTTSQLYTINLSTAAVTPVGPAFPSVVDDEGAYDLTEQTIGFDFNPRTLQADGSLRIRVVTSGGDNLRLNSDTGQVAAVDTRLAYITPIVTGVDAVAYTNSAAATSGGATTLFGIDTTTDGLVRQGGVDGTPSPNGGLLTPIGPLGVSVNSLPNVGFDIFSTGSDDGNADELAYAVFVRPDAPIGDPGKYLLYDVNLGTGQVTGGRLVGGGIDFTGGFAVIPEPSTWLLGACAIALILSVRWNVNKRGYAQSNLDPRRQSPGRVDIALCRNSRPRPREPRRATYSDYDTPAMRRTSRGSRALCTSFRSAGRVTAAENVRHGNSGQRRTDRQRVDS